MINDISRAFFHAKAKREVSSRYHRRTYNPTRRWCVVGSITACTGPEMQPKIGSRSTARDY